MNEEQNTVFGIDLGTTYSCISYLDETGRPVTCMNVEGKNTTPSVVILPLEEDDEVVVGETAKQQASMYPYSTMSFVKLKIGRVENLEYGAEDSRKTVSPVAVSAEVLKKLARDAQAYTNMPVKDVVITVPAYFGENEKAATKEAGIQAGLNVVDIVEEPTAAAFYYGCQHDDNDEVICVFDLGGGTFDVTVMKLESGSLRVITTDGNHELGGFLWDESLMNLVEGKFRDETGYEDEFQPDIINGLQVDCEAAKQQLTSAPTAVVKVFVDRQNNKAIKITREEFEDSTASLLDRAIRLTREVFDRVAAKGLKVDKILLVGGSTKMLQVKKALEQEFGMEPIGNEPDESVSKGACIYCAWKINKVPDVTPDSGDEGVMIGEETVTDVHVSDTGAKTISLTNKAGETRSVTIALQPKVAEMVIITVATKSFGVKGIDPETQKEVIQNLLVKDAVLPASFTATFTTYSANMSNINIELFQSETLETIYDADSGQGVKIGEGVLEGLPAGLPIGSPVDITLSMKENGMIEVTGVCQGTPLQGSVQREYLEGVGQRT